MSAQRKIFVFVITSLLIGSVADSQDAGKVAADAVKEAAKSVDASVNNRAASGSLGVNHFAPRPTAATANGSWWAPRTQPVALAATPAWARPSVQRWSGSVAAPTGGNPAAYASTWHQPRTVPARFNDQVTFWNGASAGNRVAQRSGGILGFGMINDNWSPGNGPLARLFRSIGTPLGGSGWGSPSYRLGARFVALPSANYYTPRGGYAANSYYAPRNVRPFTPMWANVAPVRQNYVWVPTRYQRYATHYAEPKIVFNPRPFGAPRNWTQPWERYTVQWRPAVVRQPYFRWDFASVTVALAAPHGIHAIGRCSAAERNRIASCPTRQLPAYAQRTFTGRSSTTAERFERKAIKSRRKTDPAVQPRPSAVAKTTTGKPANSVHSLPPLRLGGTQPAKPRLQPRPKTPQPKPVVKKSSPTSPWKAAPAKVAPAKVVQSKITPKKVAPAKVASSKVVSAPPTKVMPRKTIPAKPLTAKKSRMPQTPRVATLPATKKVVPSQPKPKKTVVAASTPKVQPTATVRPETSRPAKISTPTVQAPVKAPVKTLVKTPAKAVVKAPAKSTPKPNDMAVSGGVDKKLESEISEFERRLGIMDDSPSIAVIPPQPAEVGLAAKVGSVVAKADTGLKGIRNSIVERVPATAGILR